MTIGDLMIDPDLAAEWELDNALDADNDDPFAGDDPDNDYLAEEAERRARDHRDHVHGGRACTCPTGTVQFSSEAPF